MDIMYVINDYLVPSTTAREHSIFYYKMGVLFEPISWYVSYFVIWATAEDAFFNGSYTESCLAWISCSPDRLGNIRPWPMAY